MTRRLDTCRAGDVVIVGRGRGRPGPHRPPRRGGAFSRGSSYGVQQTRPVVVVESDETVLALERHIASGVLVADAPAGTAGGMNGSEAAE